MSTPVHTDSDEITGGHQCITMAAVGSISAVGSCCITIAAAYLHKVILCSCHQKWPTLAEKKKEWLVAANCCHCEHYFWCVSKKLDIYFLFLMCCILNYCLFFIQYMQREVSVPSEWSSQGLDVQVQRAAHESDGSGTGSSEVRVGPRLSP